MSCPDSSNSKCTSLYTQGMYGAGCHQGHEVSLLPLFLQKAPPIGGAFLSAASDLSGRQLGSGRFHFPGTEKGTPQMHCICGVPLVCSGRGIPAAGQSYCLLPVKSFAHSTSLMTANTAIIAIPSSTPVLSTHRGYLSTVVASPVVIWVLTMVSS